MLPNLKGKHVLDVGSRIGAVLYAAALFSHAEQITGVELNKDWASISEATVKKYNLQVHAEFQNPARQISPRLHIIMPRIMKHQNKIFR